jgi:BolA family transcriptional regulator, general stress-responsive regulator
VVESTRDRIERILRRQLQPIHLVIEDESSRHAGHAGAASGGGHFQVLVVSARFDGRTILEQHRMVNDALRELLGGEIHALGLRTVPASDWKGPAPGG